MESAIALTGGIAGIIGGVVGAIALYFQVFARPRPAWVHTSENRLQSGLRVEVTNVGPGDAFDVRLSVASPVGWSDTIWKSPRVAPSEKLTSNGAIDVTLQRMIEGGGAWMELSWRQLPNTKRLRQMRIDLPPDEAPLASLNNRVPPRRAVKREGRRD